MMRKKMFVVTRVLVIALFLVFNHHTDAEATSIIYLQFDFTSGGASVGSGTVEIGVTPYSLPLDQWTTFEEVNVLQAAFSLVSVGNTFDSDQLKSQVNNDDSGEFFIKNLNPQYPVQFEEAVVFTSVLLFDLHLDISNGDQTVLNRLLMRSDGQQFPLKF